MTTKKANAASKSEKNIDAVSMKNHIQAALYEETKDMSQEELIAFYKTRAKSGPFKKRRT